MVLLLKNVKSKGVENPLWTHLIYHPVIPESVREARVPG